MRVKMLALVVGSMLSAAPVLAHAQSTGPIVRGQPGQVERGRDRDRRDGSWDWQRDDRGRRDRDDRYDARNDRRDDRYDDRNDRRNDRHWQKEQARRERELSKREQQCERDLWRSSRYSRNDRYDRYDRWDARDVARERERISRVCQRQVYGRGW